MRLPRFTTRRLMLLVAIAAAAMAAEQTGRRWFEYRRRAEFHARREGLFRKSPRLSDLGRIRQDNLGVYICGAMLRGFREAPHRLQYHIELRRKYERAMWRPWEDVSPDPPFHYVDPIYENLRPTPPESVDRDRLRRMLSPRMLTSTEASVPPEHPEP
jgi:hypothetical protein